MNDLLWIALGLMLVFEGLAPVVAPEGWQKWMRQMSEQPANRVRQMGIMSMLIGAMVVSYFAS